MIKYNIVVVYFDYKTEIIKTFLSHKDSIEYLSYLIDKNYKGEKEFNYKVYYDNKDIITVFNLGYFSKSMYAKYYIIKYEDLTENNDEYSSIE
jgi:hypothetical protein